MDISYPLTFISIVENIIGSIKTSLAVLIIIDIQVLKAKSLLYRQDNLLAHQRTYFRPVMYPYVKSPFWLPPSVCTLWQRIRMLCEPFKDQNGKKICLADYINRITFATTVWGWYQDLGEIRIYRYQSFWNIERYLENCKRIFYEVYYKRRQCSRAVYSVRGNTSKQWHGRHTLGGKGVSIYGKASYLGRLLCSP